jgi:hypothetical protein
VTERHEVVPPLAAAEALAAGEVPGDRRPSGIPGRARSSVIGRVVVYVLLIGVALLFFTPFLWSVSTSLKTLPESVRGFDLLPDDPTLNAYPGTRSPTSTSRATPPTAPSWRSC